MDCHSYNFDYQQWSASAYQDPNYFGSFYAYSDVHVPVSSTQNDAKKPATLPDTTNEPNPDDFRELSALVHGMPSEALLCGDSAKMTDFGVVETASDVNHRTSMAPHQQQLAANQMYFGRIPMGLTLGFMEQQVEMNKSEEIVENQEFKEKINTLPSLAIEIPRHTSRKHNTHKCTYCPKRYVITTELQNHMIECQKVRAHACQLCVKRFTNRGGLIQHMKAHRGERPYKCHFCDQRFNQKSHLDQHERIHTGAKPFSCSICGQAFRQRSQQLGHEARHNKSEYTYAKVQVGVISQSQVHDVSNPEEQSLSKNSLLPTRKTLL